MTTQPEALRLAERLDPDLPTILRIDAEHAGVELRRLHAESVKNAVDFVEHQRELSKALDQRDELLVALCHIEGVAMADEPRDLPGIAQTARAAIAKVEAGK